MTVPPARTANVTANGWRFASLEWGPADGRTVLLLHGFPQNATSWAAVASRLAETGLRAVAVDLRGYSDGARPAEVAEYAMPYLVADVVGMIGALGGAVDLVGHDFGGVVGWQVVARYPQLVRTWTAVSTPNPLALNEALAADEQQRTRFGYMVGFREAGRAEAALLADDAAGLRAFYGGAVAPDRLDADVAFMSRPGVLTAALNWYRAMSRADTDGIGPVQVPTSYLWGSADMAFGRMAAERTGAYVAASYEFVLLERASHWLPDEAPDALAVEISRRVLRE